MEITTTQFKHCDLIKLAGRVDSSTAPDFEAAVKEITDNGRYKVVLDLNGVDFISSAGLRVMVNALKTCKRYNRGDFVLVNVPDHIRRGALDLSGFVSLFKIFDETLSAVGNF